MTQEQRAIDIEAQAATALERCETLNNSYLRALKNGEMSLEAFRLSQEQFYYAVLVFSRPMAGLVARIPDPYARVEILRNVVEEHGNFHEAEFHKNTFLAFLDSIGADTQAVENIDVWPEIRAFNLALSAACLLDEVEVGVACMGVIEFAFSSISGQIGKAVVERGWVEADKLTHYSLHEALDIKHAADFFALAATQSLNSERGYFVSRGLELGAYIFSRLYQDLWQRARLETAQ